MAKDKERCGVARDNEALLRVRLEQQQLMSEISASFLSKAPMKTLIEDALRKVGMFLDVTRILLAVTEKDSEASHPMFFWFSAEKWIPNPSTDGFNDIINSTFPRVMPESGEVPTVYTNNTATDYDGRYRIFEIVNLKSFIWAPLYVDGLFWGILSVEECVSPRAWSKSDAQLVSTVSTAISGAVAREIMEREREEALAKAVQASEAKSNFLSNMSHEMRTPMNAIIGMTTIGRAADATERKNYAFDKISEASKHLLGVINDILDMSKIEANKLELSPVPFDFERMLEKVVTVISFRLEERGQHFHVSIDKRIPPILIGDDQRLAQVVTNLLSNAVKFTPEQGDIRLDAVYDGEENGVYTIRVSISDTGIGLSEEQMERLFTSFEQAESGTSRKFGGTGLGLAISKRIIEMMDGTIAVKSEVGKGSVFSFTFKAARDNERQRSQLKEGVNWTNIRILAVDDESEIREYFSDLATRYEIKCDAAGSAEEALSFIEKNGSYDIYFIDWRMPGTNGTELARKIRERSGDKCVVTMISASDWNEIEEEAKAVGVCEYLPKPLFPSAITNLINKCIGQERLIDSNMASGLATGDFSAHRILLAEDVEINREIVLTLLEPTGLMIDTAENGLEAAQLFEKNPDRYDMIFMDVQMPEMDGYEATRRIRALDMEQARRIPIIAMTANVFREDVEKCLASGMNGHIGKPLDLPEVIRVLRERL